MLHVIEYFPKSLKVIQYDTPEYGICKSLKYSIVTASLSRTVSENSSKNDLCVLKIWVTVYSRSPKWHHLIDHIRVPIGVP